MRNQEAIFEPLWKYGLVISCEHGGNQVPELYRDFFRSDESLLDSHRGYDPGALLMARVLARRFRAPLVAATVTRLLVDLNRSIGHPRLHGASVPKAPALRQEILQRFYFPYREQAELLVNDTITEVGHAVHISSHSFVPELEGRHRHADIGLLYDPARSGEAGLSALWKARLNVKAPELIVRRNYPYAGRNDGLTTWFRRRLPADAYTGVELEISQAHTGGASSDWRRLRGLLVESLRDALTTWHSTWADIQPVPRGT